LKRKVHYFFTRFGINFGAKIFQKKIFFLAPKFFKKNSKIQKFKNSKIQKFKKKIFFFENFGAKFIPKRVKK